MEKTKEALSSYMKNKLALKKSKLLLRELIEKEYPGIPNCISTAFYHKDSVILERLS